LNLRPSGYELELRLYTGSCPTGPSEHGGGRQRACQHRFRSVRFVRYSTRELWSPPVLVSQCVIHGAFLKCIVGRWQAIVISSDRVSASRDRCFRRRSRAKRKWVALKSSAGFRVGAGFDSGRRGCGDRNGIGRACCKGACYFIFASYYCASACWYLCWYRQQ
jgi:hypothetical protein